MSGTDALTERRSEPVGRGISLVGLGMSLGLFLSSGTLAGISGGIAEILWIAVWATLTAADAGEVARGVAAVFAPGATAAAGIAIHMILAVALGIALVAAWRGLSAWRPGIVDIHALAMAALAGVWATNFFIVLPIVGPAFIELVPYPVSLVSKLLFAFAAATTLRRFNAHAMLAAQT